jgi:hypothetical protein
MRRCFLTTLGLLLGLAPSVLATPHVTPPACVANTLDQYLLIGPGGCSIGDEIAYFGFSFAVVSSGGGAIPIAAADILMTPTAGDFLTSLAFSSSGFSVTGNESVTYRIGYTIDPHPILYGFEDFMDVSSPVFPGSATITTDLCIGAAFTGISCLGPGVPDSVQVFHAGTTSQLSDSTNFTPTAVLGVLHTIVLAANGASADFNGVTSSTTITPEPATWLLIGSGLFGAGLLRRRREKSL